MGIALESTCGVHVCDRIFLIMIRKDVNKENYDIQET
jgi:hypothetical protein